MKDHIQLIQKLSARLNAMIEHSQDEMLSEGLRHALEDLLYVPPECMGHFGNRINCLLIDYCCKEDTDWKNRVIDDWTGVR